MKFLILTLLLLFSNLSIPQIRDSIVYVPGETVNVDLGTFTDCVDLVRLIEITLPSDTNYFYSDTSCAIVIVDDINISPIANTNGPFAANVGEDIAFTSAGSYDPDGNIDVYLWNFGDGTSTNLINPIHSYSSAGTYIVGLTVYDNDGAQSTDLTTASVSDLPPPPTGDRYYGRIYLESEADFIVPGDFPDIYSINYSQIPEGSTILISGTYSNTWRPNGLTNIIFLFKDFVMDGQGIVKHAIYINGGDGVEFHSVDGDNTNAKFREYTGKIIDQHDGTDMVFDGLHLRTEIDGSGGQTDIFYFQDIVGLKITNCDAVIYNRDGGHNDLAQFYRCGDILVWNYKGRQENDKTTDAQGIYATTMPAGGTYTVQYCNIFGYKNLITVKNEEGSVGRIDIRNNVVECKGYKPIWLYHPNTYNQDIKEVNDIFGSFGGDAVVIN